MIVLKFGGTSVANAENIQRVERILATRTKPYLVVVSALSGITSKLEALVEHALANEYSDLLNEIIDEHQKVIHDLGLADTPTCDALINNLFTELTNVCNSIAVLQEASDASIARLCSLGEKMSSTIIHQYLQTKGFVIEWLDSRDYILADGDFLNATVNESSTKENIQKLDKSKYYITGGFCANNPQGKTMLLGRGGSDYTASIFARYLNASTLEVWSDVSGMLKASPKIVSDAEPIPTISYKEALEMAYFGAKVLYPPTIKPVLEANIPVRLKNTFSPEHAGTLIVNYEQARNDDMRGDITGITSLTDMCLVNFTGVGLARTVGVARRFFSALEEANVNIVLISQSCSENSICIAINQADAEKGKEAIEQAFAQDIVTGQVDSLRLLDNMSVIAVVGDRMKHRTGLAGLIFQSLGQNGINIHAIAQGANERNISVVVSADDEDKAVKAIYQRFFRSALRRVNLFVAGTGNVGGAFLDILTKQIPLLRQENQLDIRLVGVANSTKMRFEPNGLPANVDVNAEGVPYADFQNFVDAMASLNLENSVFVDNTASEAVASKYEAILKHSIAVVTCNKIAQSDNMTRYRDLQTLSKQKQASFRYETAVGAALPIIKTINDLRLSGDRITKIQAVLSGSLNFIFNQYDASESFASVVRRASDEGYTEPNPLIDLSGLDVIRKLVILARESGYDVEQSSVMFNSFLPDACLNAPDNESLYSELERAEPHFKQLFDTATADNAKLKVVAQLDGNQLSVGLQHIHADSAFYHLENKDNIVAISTIRYAADPLIIKGAGAGADVTASGVFSDVLFAVNQSN